VESNSELEELRIDKQLARGASIIQSNDPRFSKLLVWFWGFLGVAAVTGAFAVASNLYDLNMTVAKLADNNLVTTAKLQDHEERIRQVERNLSSIEGRVFRGVDGYEKDKREPARGN
jgi:hypothetical protein